MDINALYDREVAYYSGRPIVVYLPDANQELSADVIIGRTSTGVRTTITAPFNPVAGVTIDEVQVINKTPGAPNSYTGLFTSPRTATLTPAPQLLVGQQVTIGSATYEVAAISGSSVTFERSVSDVLVYVAQVVTDAVEYQWQRLEGATWVDIPSAVERTYEPIPSDVGKDLRVRITYTDGRGEVGDSQTSQPTFTPSQTLTIVPQYPKIAEMTLDVQRTYAANSINTLVIEIDSV